MTVQIWYRLAPEERAGVIRCLVEELEYSISDIARAAGVSPAAVSQWVSGKNAPTADKLERLYQYMGETLERCLPEPPISQLDIAHAINIIAKALRSKTWREHVIRELSGILPGLKLEIAYTATKEDIELFRARALADGVMPKTLRDYVKYLVRYLDHVGWVLTPESIQKVYTFDNSDKVRREAAKALKRFIDTVVRMRDPQLASLLYDSFVTIRPKPAKVEQMPTLDEVRAVFREAEKISPIAATMWGLLAETGARFAHLLNAPMEGLQLDRLRIILNQIGKTKRQPLVFLSECAAQYLRNRFLPAREEHLHLMKGHEGKLFPVGESTMHMWLKAARETAGLPWLEPRLLRKFFAQYLLDRGVDPNTIALLQGRALPSGVAITVDHYIYDYERRLRKVWEENRPVVFEC